MSVKRYIEIFSAGCPICQETIAMVRANACPFCEINVLEVNDPDVAARAKNLGIRSVPAVAIDGKPANCCAGRGPDLATLKSAGLGEPLP